MDLSTLRNRMRARLPDTIADLRAKTHQHAGQIPPREAGYTIVNADHTTVIRLYDEIWFLGVNAEDFVADLDAITTPNIRVEINSPGGDVFDAIAIYNALRTHPAQVTTRVDGIAASAASLIVQAGDHRQMLSSAQMMIHNAWGMTVGDHQAHADMRDLLEQQDDIIAGIYATASGGERDHFRSLMDAETWMTDQRAVDEGLADEVVEPERPTQNRAPTLHDEISEAMDVVSAATASAERVGALRAEAGKDLSNVNRESLDGLRDALDRLNSLLTTEETHSDDDANNLYAEFVALTQGVAS